ncbi:MAG TPA: putative RNA uridine N3 methyltransferase [Candidatus Limnocylindrales bacterium]|nr:putative RNA uridine N3 methyltransferase [Candidatus Limnocylindrales bacterium]
MDKKKLVIGIPASTVSDTPHLREKTAKVGLIGRAAAIFRVNEIIVYPDSPKENQSRDLDFMALLLNYLDTPQYLRKAIFKIDPRMQFAGILPPLRTPHHPVSGKTRDLKAGDYREGLVSSKSKEGLLVDIGVEQPAILRETQYGVSDRLTLQVVNVGERVEVQTVNRDDIEVYWGFKVHVENRPFGQLVTAGKFDLTIATSRLGVGFKEVAAEIGAKWSSAHHVFVAFGAPTRGLHEIAEEEGLKLEAIVDFVVNTIPQQGTATVRIEEALLASLAVLNAQFIC